MECVRGVYLALCTLGILLSTYAYYIERRLESEEKYDGALCDIGGGISCSTVLASDLARGMGIVGPLLGDSNLFNFSNSLYGILLYCLLIVLVLLPGKEWLLLLLQTIAVMFEVYLIYLLFLLEDLCPICTTVLLINVALWPCAFCLWQTNVHSPNILKTTLTKKSE